MQKVLKKEKKTVFNFYDSEMNLYYFCDCLYVRSLHFSSQDQSVNLPSLYELESFTPFDRQAYIILLHGLELGNKR